MNAMSNDRRDFVRAVYEQHCHHIRHLESRVMYYLIAFSLITAAIVAWEGNLIFASSGRLSLLIIAILALLGVFLSRFNNKTLDAYYRSRAYILERYSLDHYLPMESEKTEARDRGTGRLYLAYYLLFLILVLITILAGLI